MPRLGYAARALTDFVRVVASFVAGSGGLRPAHRLRGAGSAHYPLDLSARRARGRSADFALPASFELANEEHGPRLRSRAGIRITASVLPTRTRDGSRATEHRYHGAQSNAHAEGIDHAG
jgi:hypothetical protein